jgi:hypothetical protein
MRLLHSRLNRTVAAAPPEVSASFKTLIGRLPTGARHG